MKKSSTTDGFFSEPKEKSKIKTYIVSEFFKAYYPILSNSNRTKNGFAYIDLFSGPGFYDDNSKSTPLVLLDIVNQLKPSVLAEIHMVFNDSDKTFYESLKTVVEEHPVYNKLKYKPQIFNLPAKDVNVREYLNSGNPIFSFVDPWGYKDVSASQITDFVSPVGSDCILFFNVNRILQDLSKTTSEAHMRKIFGEEFDDAIVVAKDKQRSQNAKSKEFVKLFSKNLYNNEFQKKKGKHYRLFVLPFEFKQDSTEKTSHYLLFISKNHKAVLEMKKIMIKQSNSHSVELSYDDKNALNMCFLNREDNLFIQIEKMIRQMLFSNKQLFEKELSLLEWFELMDAYSMSKNYMVTPYAFNEFHAAIKQLDSKGYITVTSEIKRERVTQKAIIKFNKEIMEN